MMQTYTTGEAQAHFDEFIETAQHDPVRVTHNERAVGVMMSAEHFEVMHSFYADRLRSNLRNNAANATNCGLTDDRLAAMLADES